MQICKLTENYAYPFTKCKMFIFAVGTLPISNSCLSLGKSFSFIDHFRLFFALLIKSTAFLVLHLKILLYYVLLFLVLYRYLCLDLRVKHLVHIFLIFYPTHLKQNIHQAYYLSITQCYHCLFLTSSLQLIFFPQRQFYSD